MVFIELVLGGFFVAAGGATICQTTDEEPEDELERQRSTASMVSDCRRRLLKESDEVAKLQLSTPEASPRRSGPESNLAAIALRTSSPTDVTDLREDAEDMRRLRKKYGLGESPRFPTHWYNAHEGDPNSLKARSSQNLAVAS